MSRSKFTHEQIIHAIREREMGRAINEICEDLGISMVTFYNWRKKYARKNILEHKRMKELEEENERLKKMYANLSLTYEILKMSISKKN